MQITLDFQDGTPDVPRGGMRYYFVRSRSKHDGKVRVFGAWYLNEYGLEYDGPCPHCPFPDGEEDCPATNGDGCPTTGWFEERFDPEYESSYYRLEGEILGFAPQPEPVN